MKRPHLMVMAGGTGGHVFPALAVAKELRNSGVDITWLGTKRGLESKVVPDNKFAIEWVTVEGLRGKGRLSLVLAPFKLFRAMWQSAKVIRRIKPDCILGMGGFVSGPGGLIARLMGRPLVIHEQNAVAGLTNYYLAKLANRVLSGFPDVQGLPKDTLWVGNPVRDDISTEHTNKSSKVNVLIIGGSQGAHSFNVKLPDVFAALDSDSVEIWHQSGKGRSRDVIERYQSHGVDAKVSEFVDDMAAAYAWADLLVCRAGAMTVAECCAAAKPALLIPYPFSAGDHQEKNAMVMVGAGAGKMVSNDKIGEQEFNHALEFLLRDKSALREMGQKAFSLHKPSSLDEVVAICQEYLNA